MNNLSQMDEQLRLWAAQVIAQTEGKRPGNAGHAAIILSEGQSLSRMKGGVNTLAMALLALNPADRLSVMAKMLEVSPGLLNRIMNELRGQVGRATRHDLVGTIFMQSRHVVLSDIVSNERAERVGLAIEHARFTR